MNVARLLVIIPALVAALLLGGCSDRQTLRATEGEVVDTVQGQQGSRYSITVAGDTLGDATVWSEDLVTRGDAGSGSLARFGLTIENNGDAAMSLDRDQLRLQLREGEVWPESWVAPASVAGPEPIEPGSVADLTVEFHLPDLADPDRVDAARLRWGLRIGDRSFNQVTPFVEERPQGVYGYGVGYHAGYHSSWWRHRSGWHSHRRCPPAER